jgi:uncharacterized membrane protein
MYKITALDTGIPGDRVYPTKINNHANVVGYITRQLKKRGTFTRAFIFSKGLITDLSPIGSSSRTIARCINDAGTIVGQSGEACLWPSPSSTPVFLDSILIGSQAVAVNSAGLVAGNSIVEEIVINTPPPGSLQRAFVQDTTGNIDLLEKFSGVDLWDPPYTFHPDTAWDLNSIGTAVGWSLFQNGGEAHPTRWRNAMREDLSTPLAGADSFSGVALGVNDNDVAVGWLEAPLNSSRLATMWTQDSVIYLPLPDSHTSSLANDISNNDVVVGFASNSVDGARAMRWVGGLPQDLNDTIDPSSGWVLTNAISINDRGHIVGVGTFQGKHAAWILSPSVSAIDWRSLPAYVVKIVAGVVSGGHGWVLGPGGPEPVPPPNPAWESLSLNVRAELVALAASHLSKGQKMESVLSAVTKRVQEVRRG